MADKSTTKFAYMQIKWQKKYRFFAYIKKKQYFCTLYSKNHE